MQNVQRFEREIAGRKLSIEIGRLATQAHGSCVVRYGDSVVLATAVKGGIREGMDYFPLTVDYEERLYAAGKIKGSRFIKREGRPTDEAILTTRLVDRSIRPLFDQRMRFDVQVITTVLSVDGENDPDVIALIAASCAVMISPIPWGGPVAAVRIGRLNDAFIVNPTYEQKEQSTLDLVVAGTRDQIVMIEAGAKEELEENVAAAIRESLPILSEVMALLEEIRAAVGQEKVQWSPEPILDAEGMRRLNQMVTAFVEENIPSVMDVRGKADRAKRLKELEDEVVELISKDPAFGEKAAPLADEAFKEMYAKHVRRRTLETGVRADGRKAEEIRSLSADVALLPRTHGSGLFQRGDTQVLSIVTLGAPGAEQTMDEMEIEGKKRYMHHYNFPPYSVGEVKPMRGPGRREIGHGALAEKALVPVIPSKEEFPYTIRVVSEVLESNGSSSQASICGSTLSLMDAGVPIKAPVAGIAMGLYVDDRDPKRYVILTDIQGIEDHDGDMDFKVAGTAKGITAIQLDIKLGGISTQICAETIAKARQARTQILDTIQKTLPEPRKELSPYAPRIETLQVDPDKIREIIGTGGKVINKIIEETGVEIDIEDSGLVLVTSTDADGMKKALDWIKNIVREIEVGEEFEGTVTQIVKDRMGGGEIGAIVEFLPGKDGMIHISELEHRHIERVTDVINIGDKVRVKVKDVDKERGRISLSRKALIPRPLNGGDDEDQGGGHRHGGSGGGGGGFSRFGRRPGGGGGNRGSGRR